MKAHELFHRPLVVLLSLALVWGMVPTQALAELLDEGGSEDAVLVTEGDDAADVTDDESAQPQDNLVPQGEETIQDEAPGSSEGSNSATPVLMVQSEGLEWEDSAQDVRYIYDTVFDEYGSESVTITDIKVMSEHPDASIDLVIPSSIDGKPVATLGRSNPELSALNDSNNTAIRSITIPSSVRALRGNVFSDSSHRLHIKQVTFEDGVQITEIPRNCFGYLPIESIVVPEGVTSIGDYAFFGCHDLASVSLPSTLETIGEASFLLVNSLTSLVVPEGVTSIGPRAFEPEHGKGEPNGTFSYSFVGGTTLKSVTLPNSLKSIGERAFYGNTALATVKIGTSMADAQLEAIPDQAFAATSLTSIEIPDTVTSIGEGAFDWEPVKEGLSYLYSFKREGTHTLASVALGSSQEASQLQSIGINAFRDATFTSIAIPNSLKSLGYTVDEERDVWESPFAGCTMLQSIAWPTAQTADSFTAVGGFWNCYRLSDDNVINNLPSWIDTIDAAAFANNAFTDVVIPDTVTTIGAHAFHQHYLETQGYIPSDGDEMDESQGMSSLVIGDAVTSIGEGAFEDNNLTSLTIKDSATPLTIGDYAFAYNYTLDGVDIILPARVSYLGASVFSCVGTSAYGSGEEDYEAHNSYYLYNRDLAFKYYDEAFADEGPWDPWDASSDSTTVVYYPSDAAPDSEIMRLKAVYDDAWEGGMRWEPFDPDDATVRHTITGTVPDDATVMLEVDYQATVPELEEKGDAQSFTAKVREGSNVLLHVYLDDYAEYVISPAGTEEAAPLNADWTPTVTTSDMVMLSTTGTLQAKLTGRNATNCNVAIIDEATGNVVSQGRAARALVYIAEQLPAGTYTVVAYADNEAFSSISGLADFATMGFDASSYAQTSVEVPAGQVVEVSLAPPALDTTLVSNVLTSGEVYIPLSHTVPNLVFSAQIRYEMADGRKADKLCINLPEGIEPVLASSVAKKYGIDGYDAAAHTLTLTGIAEADRTKGLISIGLRASDAAAGKQAVSVSLTSGNVTVPVGSAPIEINVITLDVPQGTLSTTEFDVTVYAAPETAVAFRVGQTKLEATCTTNKVGRGTATLTIPESELSIYTLNYPVTAMLAGNEGVSATEPVYYQHTDGSDVATPTVHDFSFVHAKKQVFLAKDGKDCSGGSYTVVAVPSVHKDLYSPLWPFTASIDSSVVLGDTMVLELGMLDGSERYEDMALTGTKDLGKGVKRYTYQVSVAIGDGNIDHNLTDHDVPVRFDVVPQVTEDVELPAMSQETYDMAKQFMVLRGGSGQKPEIPDNIKALFNTVSTEEWVGYFNDGWRHENWSHDSEAWQAWNQLPPESKDRFQQLENKLGDLYDTWAVVLGNRQSIFKYSSLQEYFRDNYGAETGQMASARTLERDGYRLVYDLNPSSVPEVVTPTPSGEMTTPEWVALRYDDYSIEDLLAQSEDEPILTTQESSSGTKTIKFRDSNGNAHEIKVPAKYYDSAKIPGVSAEDILTNGLDSLYKDLENYKDDTEYLNPDSAEALIVAMGGGMNNAFGSLFTMASNYETYKTANGAFDESEFIDRVNELKRLNMMDEYYNKNNPGSICQRAIRQERIFLCNYLNDLMRMMPMKLADAGFNAVSSGVGDAAMMMGQPEVAIGNAVAASTWTVGATITITDLTRKANYDRYVLQKYRAYRENVCRHDAFGKLHYKKPAIMDPSGYVYEGVESDRVSDVSAVIYQLVDGEWKPWDEAADYDQVTQQITDESGTFAWDVPVGSWKVRFTKDGYDTVESQVMDVLPEWVNVAINMLRSAGPKVDESATKASEDLGCIDVVFDQNMIADASPVITVNGTVVTEYSWLDIQDGRDGDNREAQLSRTLRIPLTAFVKPGAKLEIELSGARSYTGKAMDAPFKIQIDIPKAPTPVLNVLAGDDRYETGRKVVDAAVGLDGASYAGVVVVTGAGFADALSATGLAGALDYPIIMVAPTALGDASKAALDAVKASNGGASLDILIVGGDAAVSSSVERQLGAWGKVSKRFAGSDRYETNRQIYTYGAERGVWSNALTFVATGKNFPDALAIAPYLSWKGAPIILIDPADSSKISKASDAVRAAGGLVALGGELAVPEAQLKGTGKSYERISGEDRYETAEKVIVWETAHGMSLEGAGLSTGRNFPDALLSGFLLGKTGSVIILANTGSARDASNELLPSLKATLAGIANSDGAPSLMRVFGGDAAVPESVHDKLANAVGWTEYERQ